MNWNFGPDKFGHLIVGALIAGFGAAFAFLTGLSMPLVALIGSVAAGVAKEAYDYISGKGTPEVADFVFTMIGGLLVTIAVALQPLFSIA